MEEITIDAGIDDFLKLSEKNFIKHNESDFDFDFEYGKKKIELFTNQFNEGEAFFTCLKKDNQIVTMLYNIIYKDVLYAYMIGTDYELSKSEYSSYFNLGYYHSLEVSLAKHCTYIQCYDGLDKTKMSRGTHPEKLYLYFDPYYLDDKIQKTISKLEELNIEYFKNNVFD